VRLLRRERLRGSGLCGTRKRSERCRTEAERTGTQEMPAGLVKQGVHG